MEKPKDDERAEPTRSSVRLLRRAKQGDRLALDELFARHLAGLRRWAKGRLPRWARDAVDTADIVQESLVSVFSRLPHFEPRTTGALQAYLRQAVRNRIRDEIRRVERRPVPDPISELEVSGPSELSPLQEAIGIEAAERYRAALSRLRANEREAVVARVELGYSYDQIALVLGKTSSDAARMAVTRSLAILAREMGRDV